ncbi:hypothetical protein KSS87_012755 [Heliosperma pusillum]|nr:hypothetical protein KSS87_012755 [Heliosperma pusillum]
MAAGRYGEEDSNADYEVSEFNRFNNNISLNMNLFRAINRNVGHGGVKCSNTTKVDGKRSKLWMFCMHNKGLSTRPGEQFQKDDTILPVLIVGAGPVGLLLSILLTKLGKSVFIWEQKQTELLYLLGHPGHLVPFLSLSNSPLHFFHVIETSANAIQSSVRCAVLEKSTTFSRHPQAHFINNRFPSQVFRKLDGLADEIQQFQPPVDLWRKFIYCTSLSGSILGSVDHMQPQDFEQVVSPVTVAHFSQYKLSERLLNKLKTLNFRFHEGNKFDRHVEEREILMGHEVLSFIMTENCVNVTCSVDKDGQKLKRDIQCGILVGTDGAGSTVRKLAGIAMEGERDLQKLVSVHFVSRDLGRYLLKERPGMLFFIFNTEAIGVLVAHDLQQGEFVLQVPYYPPQQKFEEFTPKMCEQLIFTLVGHELEDITVIDVKPWVMHAEVADKFLSCNNQIILAGDAAHRFPPAGGFGMNTGIQDAHNLAWKLAAVVNGIAPVTLLNTYETERRPIALFNTALSVENFRAAMEVPAALGLDPTIANSVHKLVTDGLGSILPSGLQRVVLDGIFSIGRAQLSQTVLNERNPIGSLRLARLKRIFEEGKSLQLQFPAEDLGFRYVEGALVSDRTVIQDTEYAPTGRRRDYVPSSEPGSRLPHMKIRSLSNVSGESVQFRTSTFELDSGSPVHCKVMSTLDLLQVDKLEFLLIIAPVKSSYDLGRTMLEVAKKFNALVKVCVIWPEKTANGVNVTPPLVDSFTNVVEVKSSRELPSWWDVCQMNDRGAILVRPDEHIAWRARSAISDPMAEMERVFTVVLGNKA